MYYSRMIEPNNERFKKTISMSRERGSNYLKARTALVVAAALGFILGTVEIVPQGPAYIASFTALIAAHAGFTRR